jgi:hypothetical protein
LIYILSNSNSFQVGLTLYNLKNIETLVNRVIKSEALVLLITLELRKLQKFATKLNTNSTIQNSVNKEFLGQLKKEDNKKKQIAAGNKNLIGITVLVQPSTSPERYVPAYSCI